MSWYASVPSSSMLDNWIKNSYNVLFHGRHGVGKTSLIFDAFKRIGWELGIDYLYFSAATIDPWVDLIGVPSKVTNSEGEEVLKLIRPASINNNTVKAFFVDEFNRSHKKVRNAMMELIQFKSINGLKFPNLKIIWGAVNPDDDNELKFDVEKLDPAQEDRFQIHVQIPYKPSQSFFAERFNDPEMAEAVCKWWNDQNEKVKLEITPRRLEYAIDVFNKTNDLRFVIPSEAHAPSLKSAIQSGNPEKTLRKMIDAGDEIEIRRWLAVDNNLTSVQNLLSTDRNIIAKVIHLLSEERLIAFASKHKPIQEQIKTNPKKFEKIIRSLAENSTHKLLKDMCLKLIPFLDGPENSLLKIHIAAKPVSDLGLTKRRKAQIISNYDINIDDVVICSNGEIEDKVNGILSLATECSFATNTYQRMEILAKLEKIVSRNMNKNEADVSLKILENIISYVSKEGIDSVINRYLPVINSIVISWFTNQNNFTIHSLFSAAPYLTTNILSIVADNLTKYNITSKLAFEKISDDKFDNIPEEMEFQKKQNVEDLF